MNNEKKQYWVLVSFMIPSVEPRAGYICVNADDPEEAEKVIREGIGHDVTDLFIESISEDVPEEVKAQIEANKPTSVN